MHFKLQEPHLFLSIKRTANNQICLKIGKNYLYIEVKAVQKLPQNFCKLREICKDS